jgi:tetratricopeptide (TPR) repeat protein
VLVTSRIKLASLALAAAVAFFVTGQPLFAQAAQPSATQGSQPQWKDRAEYDLYDAISKETQPAKRLDLLNQWKEKYPTSEFTNIRQQLFLATYSEMQKWPEVFSAAKEILNKDPHNIAALSKIMSAIFVLQSPSPDDLATAEQAANTTINNLDSLFAPDKKPANVKDADWEASKKPMQMLAQNTLGYVALQRKDYDKAKTAFTKSLQLDPNAPMVSYWLGIAMIGTKDYAPGLYEYARAVGYTGQGALAAQQKQTIRSQLENYYTQYHGSNEGLDQLISQAQQSALPPAGFKLPSKADLAQQKLQQEEEFAKEHPELALWRRIKAELTGPNAETYWENNMKDRELPEFKGRLLEAKPEVRPKELVLAIDDNNPGVTLKFEEPLPGKMAPGAELSFVGVAKSFTPNPYNVTFEVTKEKLQGWKPEPAPASKSRKRK